MGCGSVCAQKDMGRRQGKRESRVRATILANKESDDEDNGEGEGKPRTWNDQAI